MIAQGKTKSDICSYMITGLSFPSLVGDIIEYKALGSPILKDSLINTQESQDTTNEQSKEKEENKEQPIEEHTKKEETHHEEILKKGKQITREQAIQQYGKTPAVRNFNP